MFYKVCSDVRSYCMLEMSYVTRNPQFIVSNIFFHPPNTNLPFYTNHCTIPVPTTGLKSAPSLPLYFLPSSYTYVCVQSFIFCQGKQHSFKQTFLRYKDDNIHKYHGTQQAN